MKVIFITTESFMDHSFTIICEIKKHVQLETFFIAKKLTPEIKDFCDRLNAKFVKRKRFINPFRIIYELRLLAAIKKHKADLVWFNSLSLVQAFFLKLFISKPLITVHDVEVHPEDTDYHGILSQKLTFKLFKKCIAVMSFSQADQFEKKYGFKPYILQLPLIDYYEVSSEKKDFTADKPSKARFLFFGSIQPYKGIEILIKAVEILNSKNVDFELKICGRIRYNHDKLTSKIAKLKNVTHINMHINYKDVYMIYKSSDVIVIPYIHVTQSGPLLIGYNQNIPCITNDLPGFREYIDDGKSGLLFNNSPEDLALKMEDIIRNKNNIPDMSKYISKEIKTRFSMQLLVSSYINVFKKHLG